MKSKIFGNRPQLFFGENSFEISLAINKNKSLAKKHGFLIEIVDGEQLALEKFIDLLGGMSLFSDLRLVIIKNLSQNSEIWPKIIELLSRVSNDTALILVEEKLDKRTKLTKDLLKKVDYQEFKSRSGDRQELINLAKILAKKQKLAIGDNQARFLVDHVGADEWAIKQAIDRLSLIGSIDEDKIRHFLPQNQEANVFEILRDAINRQPKEVDLAIDLMKNNQDVDAGYQFFGLISAQLFNLAALKIGLSEGYSTTEIAKKIGANSWALNQIKDLANSLNLDELQLMIDDFVVVDEILKTANADIWELLAALLLKIATR